MPAPGVPSHAGILQTMHRRSGLHRLAMFFSAACLAACVSRAPRSGARDPALAPVPVSAARSLVRSAEFAYFNDFLGHFVKVRLRDGSVVKEGGWPNSVCQPYAARPASAAGICAFHAHRYDPVQDRMYVLVSHAARTEQEVIDPRFSVVAFDCAAPHVPLFTISIDRGREQSIPSLLVTPDGTKLRAYLQHVATTGAVNTLTTLSTSDGRLLAAAQLAGNAWFSARAYYADDGALYDGADSVAIQDMAIVRNSVAIGATARQSILRAWKNGTDGADPTLRFLSSANGMLLYEVGNRASRRGLFRLHGATQRVSKPVELPAGLGEIRASLSPEADRMVVEVFDSGVSPEAAAPIRLLSYDAESAGQVRDVPTSNLTGPVSLVCIAPHAETLFYGQRGALLRVDAGGRATALASGNAVDFSNTDCTLTAR